MPQKYEKSRKQPNISATYFFGTSVFETSSWQSGNIKY